MKHGASVLIVGGGIWSAVGQFDMNNGECRLNLIAEITVR